MLCGERYLLHKGREVLTSALQGSDKIMNSMWRSQKQEAFRTFKEFFFNKAFVCMFIFLTWEHS